MDLLFPKVSTFPKPGIILHHAYKILDKRRFHQGKALDAVNSFDCPRESRRFAP
jgi:hypothetical protein